MIILIEYIAENPFQVYFRSAMVYSIASRQPIIKVILTGLSSINTSSVSENLAATINKSTHDLNCSKRL